MLTTKIYLFYILSLAASPSGVMQEHLVAAHRFHTPQGCYNYLAVAQDQVRQFNIIEPRVMGCIEVEETQKGRITNAEK